MSRAAGAAFPIKELSRDLLPSVAVATRIRFSCGFLPLPEPHRGLVFGNVSRGTWVGAAWPDRFPAVTARQRLHFTGGGVRPIALTVATYGMSKTRTLDSLMDEFLGVLW